MGVEIEILLFTFFLSRLCRLLQSALPFVAFVLCCIAPGLASKESQTEEERRVAVTLSSLLFGFVVIPLEMTGIC